MSFDKFENFMKGFSAARLLLNRAADNGYFIEYVCLATSFVDGLLRTALILQHQLETKTSDILDDLLYQADEDKIIFEREIYSRVLQAGIITQSLFEELEFLYNERNKVVHRYIISEITTEQVLHIALRYDKLIPEVADSVRKLEDEQIRTGIGMTVSSGQVPPSIRGSGKAQIHKLAAEKHGNPNLAKKLNGGTNAS